MTALLHQKNVYGLSLCLMPISAPTTDWGPGFCGPTSISAPHRPHGLFQWSNPSSVHPVPSTATRFCSMAELWLIVLLFVGFAIGIAGDADCQPHMYDTSVLADPEACFNTALRPVKCDACFTDAELEELEVGLTEAVRQQRAAEMPQGLDIGMMNWLSSELVSAVAGILLEEVMGYQVWLCRGGRLEFLCPRSCPCTPPPLISRLIGIAVKCLRHFLQSQLCPNDSHGSGELSDGKGDEAPWSPNKRPRFYANQPMKHSIARWRTQGKIWDWLVMAVCL